MNQKSMSERKRSEPLIRRLKCAKAHIDIAINLHKEFGSIWRVIRSIECLEEDIIKIKKILKQLDKEELDKITISKKVTTNV